MTDKILPRKNFEAIVNGCLEILVKHGLVRPKLGAMLEEYCFSGWFGMLVSHESELPGPVELTQQLIDQVTLECAQILLKHGAMHVYLDESLNTIRYALIQTLAALGYEDPTENGPGLQVIWGCYKDWERLARADGASERTIEEKRMWFRLHKEGQYEAA